MSEKDIESIHVIDRKNAIWVNVDRSERVILICEEGIHGERESVWVRPEDVASLIDALQKASRSLPHSPVDPGE